MNVGIIGLGKMGEAIAKGLLKSKIYKVYFNELRKERVQEVIQRYPQIKHLPLQQLVDVGEVIILAVKPQDISSLLKEIEQVLKREKLFISIAAGISISSIQKYLSRAKLIRAMPNMGALIGRSFTAISSSSDVTPEQVLRAKEILASIGEVREVEESQIDAVTALAGSGPAYFAYFLQALTEAGEGIGLGELASQAALSCYRATWEILSQMNISPQELIEKVASKGGTTEACIGFWQEADLRELIGAGVKKAHLRAKELARQCSC